METSAGGTVSDPTDDGSGGSSTRELNDAQRRIIPLINGLLDEAEVEREGGELGFHSVLETFTLSGQPLDITLFLPEHFDELSNVEVESTTTVNGVPVRWGRSFDWSASQFLCDETYWVQVRGDSAMAVEQAVELLTSTTACQMAGTRGG